MVFFGECGLAGLFVWRWGGRRGWRAPLGWLLRGVSANGESLRMVGNVPWQEVVSSGSLIEASQSILELFILGKSNF